MGRWRLKALIENRKWRFVVENFGKTKKLHEKATFC